jgi:3-hydroxy-9,10-secoandrosta-1,3,5(10)-triene-9,17-dione monooxygenase
MDASVELAAACGATGWVYMLWTAHMWLLALWPEAAQEEVWANPNSLASSIVNSVGEARAVPGGYRWTGRGFFSSGVDHCNWLTAAVPIVQEGHEGPPERRWLLIPRADFEIIDDWHTVGLRGTGSKTIVVDDVFVPEYRTLSNKSIDDGTAPGVAVHAKANPMYGGPSALNFSAAMASPAVGIARGFLRAFEERLRSKLDLKDAQAADGVTVNMARYAAAVAQLDAVHAVTWLNAQRFSRVPVTEVSAEDKVRVRRDRAYAAQSARKLVSSLYEECGGGGLFTSSDFQRMWRDVAAASSHHGLTWDWQAVSWTKSILGLPTGPSWTFTRS